MKINFKLFKKRSKDLFTKACPQKPYRYERYFKIHFIRSIDWRNTGDMNCDPLHYFPAFADYMCIYHDWHEIRYDMIQKKDLIILGGGGIFECSNELQQVLVDLFNHCDHIVSWGCGHNTHYDRKINIHIDYTKFLKLTVRDFKYKDEEYLPDVSCMMPILTNKYMLKRKIGVIEHLAFPIYEFNFEKISNSFAIESIIKFIGESEIIITNTWHCSYWALLMNKKVILYHPFSTKYEHYKYPPTIYSGDLEQDIKAAKNYPTFLQESMLMNKNFAKSLLNILHTRFSQ